MATNTGTGGTKFRRMAELDLFLTAVGGLASVAFDSVVPISCAVIGIALVGTGAMLAYGMGKASYNLSLSRSTE